MRRLILPAALVSFASLATSCTNSGPASLFVHTQWTVLCNEMNGCVGSEPRTIDGYSNENGWSLSCSAQATASDTTTLTFSFSHNDYYLRVTQAVFPRNGGSASSGTLRVKEANENVFIGSIGGGTPSVEQPCQMNNIVRTTDPATGSPLLRLNLMCAHMKGETVPDQIRELAGDGGGATPVTVELYDCPGI
jgi:hypothetical protein